MVLMVFAHALHNFVHAEKDGGREQGVVEDTSFIAELGDHLIYAFAVVSIRDSGIDPTPGDVG
jgi:hypothetical protein